MNELTRTWLRRIALGLPLLAGCESAPCDRRPLTEVVAIDQSQLDAEVPDGGHACIEICRFFFTGSDVTACQVTTVDGGPAVQCTHVPVCIGGRRPVDFARPDLAPASACGAWLSELASLEAGSIGAFEDLAMELEAHRGPAAWVRAALRSARDEARHARIVSALASAAGEPGVRVARVARPVRPLEEVALDNAVEGCAREALGALVAAHQARSAHAPLVRAAFGSIARDEARHALLSLAILERTGERLGPARAARLSEARRAELAAMARDHEDETPAALRHALGLPDAERTQSMIAALV